MNENLEDSAVGCNFNVSAPFLAGFQSNVDFHGQKKRGDGMKSIDAK